MAFLDQAAEAHQARFAPEDLARAAELMIRVYGKDAVRRTERICLPGRQAFADGVIEEVRARLAR